MRVSAVAVLLLAGWGADGLMAQETAPAVRPGLTLGVGVGAGTARVTCPLCAGGSGVAPSVQLRVAGFFSRTIGWGVEGNAWREEDADAGVRDVTYALGLGAYWYLGPQAPRWYVKGGLGPLWYRVEDADVEPPDEPSPAVTSTSVAGHFGVGLELPAGPLTVIPFLNYTGSMYGSLFRGDTRVSHARVSFVQLGLTLAWR